jgi:hypothetical protein
MEICKMNRVFFLIFITIISLSVMDCVPSDKATIEERIETIKTSQGPVYGVGEPGFIPIFSSINSARLPSIKNGRS